MITKMTSGVTQNQMRLAVVREIYSAYVSSDYSEDMHIPAETRSANGDLMESAGNIFLTEKYRVLKEVAATGIIKFGENDDAVAWVVTVVSSKGLSRMYAKLDSKTVEFGDQARIIYSTTSGTGTLDGKPFTLPPTSKRIFNYMVKNPNVPIDKGYIWRAAGRRGNVHTSSDTITFNTYVTNLRRELGGASPNHIRLKRQVQLHAIVDITD